LARQHSCSNCADRGPEHGLLLGERLSDAAVDQFTGPEALGRRFSDAFCAKLVRPLGEGADAEQFNSRIAWLWNDRSCKADIR